MLYCGHPISIDGLFDDWDNVPINYVDSQTDCIVSDYNKIKITHDNEFLFIYVDFYNGDFLMQDWNDFHLYIDADNDLTTGKEVHGIGAELVWNFGNREGYYTIDNQETEIMQNDITLRIAPTVTSHEFEIGLSLNSLGLTFDGTELFTHGRLVFSEINAGGDFIPDELGGINFTIIGNETISFQSIGLDRFNEDDIRLISYNTLNEGILDNEREAYFMRVIKALKPDIIALQEHGDWEQIDDVIQSWFPNQQWNASWTYRDLVVLSRFQIVDDANMINSERTMVVLLDTEQELGNKLLIFNSHLSCCGNNDLRQEQVDEFSGSWRDWMLNGLGPFPIEEGTPFVHVGDFNFVGYKEQIITIRDGDIIDENQYGDDFLPDWDSTPIIEAFLGHTHKRMGYTWRKDESSFNPGRLDYVFYSDATINKGNQFILNTLAIDNMTLDYHGLEQEDTQNASDHLPLVFDIVSTNNLGSIDFEMNPLSFVLHSNYPNPFNSETLILFELFSTSVIDITIVDISGKIIRNLMSGIKPKGNHSLYWDGLNNSGEQISTGLYFKIFKVENHISVGKMLLMK